MGTGPHGLTLTTRGARAGRVLVELGRAAKKSVRSSDPRWKATPASAAGLDFEARRYGPRLVVSTKNERAYIHDHYAFDRLVVELPPGDTLETVNRVLDGDGAPALGDKADGPR